MVENKEVKAQKSRKISAAEKKLFFEWKITERFIEEIERLERKGRVESREKLENDLLITPSGITAMRSGKVRVSVASIFMVKTIYNGDIKYILFGEADPKNSGNIMEGRKLNTFKPYIFNYRSSHKPTVYFEERSKDSEIQSAHLKEFEKAMSGYCEKVK